MNNKYKISILMAAFVIQGCSVAPFSTTPTARTVGKNNIELQAGLTANPEHAGFRFGYGVCDNFDVGFISETQFLDSVLGFWGKYAILNQQEGPAVSVEASAGAAQSSKYAYIGPNVGYKVGCFEPNVGIRYNYVSLDEITDFDWDEWRFNEQRTHLSYGTVFVGNTIWLHNKVGLNLNGNYNFGAIEGAYLGAGLIFHF